MNMDRFKFRVWHEEKKKMYTDVGFDYDTVYPIEKDETGEHLAVYTLPRKECNLMQCTGIKDSSGNLIYEGDIVRVLDLSGEVFKQGVVEFRRASFGICNENNTDGFACPCLPIDVDADYFVSKIIGNIHESEAKSE